VVAFFQTLGVDSRLRDDAGALVATRERVDVHRDVAGRHVVVGVAHPRCHHLDLDLVVTGVVDLEVHDLVLARCLADDSSTGLHSLISFDERPEPVHSSARMDLGSTASGNLLRIVDGA
jgi:hypothetical protein